MTEPDDVMQIMATGGSLCSVGGTEVKNAGRKMVKSKQPFSLTQNYISSTSSIIMLLMTTIVYIMLFQASKTH